MVQRALLTDELVELSQASPTGEVRIWDQRLKGFCLRIHATGRKVYCLKHQVGGRQVWSTISAYGERLSTAEARAEAEKILRANRRPEPRSRTVSGRLDITVRRLIVRYLEEGPAAKLSKRASSWKADACNLRRHVEPLIGDRCLGELRGDDIALMVRNIWSGETARDVRTRERGVARVRGGPGAADRALDATSAMFTWAVNRELMATNPARGIKLPRRASKARFLSVVQAQQLLGTLIALEGAGRINPVHGAAIRLLLFTGARKGEIVGLKWSEIDLDQRRIVLPPDRSKSGGKLGERRIPLSRPALEVLNSLRRGSSYALPCAKGRSGHFTGLQKTWSLVRVEAGLDGLRLHDLRHSFASFAIANGENILAISRALGHSDLRTTQLYLHLNDAAVTDLADRTGRLIAGDQARQ